MDSEITLVDESVGPNPGDQLVLADEFTGTFDQRGQDIERAASETNGLVVFQQELSRWKQAEGPERTMKRQPKDLKKISSTWPPAYRSRALESGDISVSDCDSHADDTVPKITWSPPRIRVVNITRIMMHSRLTEIRVEKLADANSRYRYQHQTKLLRDRRAGSARYRSSAPELVNRINRGLHVRRLAYR